MKQRKIMFRAWLKPDGCMADVGEIHFFRGGILVFGPGVHLGNGWASCNEEFNHECEVVLMQFTGLYDKHGKEVFEGDVVKYENKIAEIVFTNDRGYFADGWLSDFQHKTENWEIIGNVFEHPHLLEQ